MTQHCPPVRRPALPIKALAAGMVLAAAAGSAALAQGAAGSGLPGLLPPPAETSSQGSSPAAPLLGAPRERRTGRGMERRIQDWHDRLRITPAQEPQWNAFATAMRENMQRAQAMQAERRRAAPTASALDEVRAYARASQAHADDLQRLVAPFEALYNTLSPEQRQAADQAFRRFEERGNRGRRATG